MGREFPKLVTLVNLLGDNFVYLSSVYKCIIDTFLPREKFYMNTLEEEEPREGVYAPNPGSSWELFQKYHSSTTTSHPITPTLQLSHFDPISLEVG